MSQESVSKKHLFVINPHSFLRPRDVIIIIRKRIALVGGNPPVWVCAIGGQGNK
jgi:hypothetical protein